VCRLQDAARKDERVLRNLQSETRDTEKVLMGAKHLQNQLLDDMSGRVPDVEFEFEFKKDTFWYYRVRRDGDEHWRLMRLEAHPGKSTCQCCLTVSCTVHHLASLTRPDSPRLPSFWMSALDG
jgi:protease II